jgi:hypothetical protein
MKMRRLSDTKVEKRLKALFDKDASLVDRLRQKLESYNPSTVQLGDSNNPGQALDFPPTFQELSQGPGEFYVEELPQELYGREMALVSDGTREYVVDPMVAVPALPEYGATREEILFSLQNSSQITEVEEIGKEPVQSPGEKLLEEEGVSLSASVFHAEDRINLDELIQDGQSNSFGDEPGMSIYAGMDILAQVSMDGAIPPRYDDADPEASRDSLLKTVQSNILNKYPEAFVDVIEGTFDLSSVQMDGSRRASRVQEDVYDIICETRRDANTWIVFDEESW